MRRFNFFKVALCSIVICLPAFAEANENVANDVVKATNKTVNYVKDSAITGYIYAQIALDDNLSQQNVNVTTTKGVVMLEGSVGSESEAQSAIQIANGASGVVSVDATRLKIKKSKQPVSDTMITAKVKATLISQSLTNDKDAAAGIHVETQNGVVYLSGQVDQAVKVQNAIKSAQSISGVQRVESTVKVVTLGQ